MPPWLSSFTPQVDCCTLTVSIVVSFLSWFAPCLVLLSSAAPLLGVAVDVAVTVTMSHTTGWLSHFFHCHSFIALVSWFPLQVLSSLAVWLLGVAISWCCCWCCHPPPSLTLQVDCCCTFILFYCHSFVVCALLLLSVAIIFSLTVAVICCCCSHLLFVIVIIVTIIVKINIIMIWRLRLTDYYHLAFFMCQECARYLVWYLDWAIKQFLWWRSFPQFPL